MVEDMTNCKILISHAQHIHPYFNVGFQDCNYNSRHSYLAELCFKGIKLLYFLFVFVFLGLYEV